jgi:c-di-GMP-binding flagellar brake protein YcgR
MGFSIMANPDKTSPQKNSGSILYRSRIEIGRILQALTNEGIAVFANIGDSEEEQLFVSHVLSVKPDEDYFVLAYGAEKSINSALFRQAAIKLKANYQGARIAFVAYRPSDSMFDGRPAIRFVFPRALLHYHREHKRIGIPREVALRCLVGEAGIIQFELRVVDISHDGMGCVLYKGGSTLKKGTVLRNCRITQTNGKTIVADLIVRHSTPVKLRDGTMAYRTGVRFVQTPAEIKPLIDQFVRYLADAET